MARYRTKPVEPSTVNAIKITPVMLTPECRDMVNGWLVDNGKELFYLPNEKFEATYEKVEETP
jgi:hypothetical protein